MFWNRILHGTAIWYDPMQWELAYSTWCLTIVFEHIWLPPLLKGLHVTKSNKRIRLRPYITNVKYMRILWNLKHFKYTITFKIRKTFKILLHDQLPAWWVARQLTRLRTWWAMFTNDWKIHSSRRIQKFFEDTGPNQFVLLTSFFFCHWEIKFVYKLMWN